MVQGLAINCGMLGLAAAGGRGRDYTASEETFNENLLLGIISRFTNYRQIETDQRKVVNINVGFNM